MRIAVDAMGGDYAPVEIVKGALAALETRTDLHIILVGDEVLLKKALSPGVDPSRVSLVHCREIIEMSDHPALAYRRKKDASITIATRLVKKKEAQAVISAGSTGAQMVAALFELGRIKGVDRPAIGTLLPTLKGPKLLLDAGANADCKPENLVQFAQMGSIYARAVLGLSNTQVALISIGEEAAKGNEMTIKAHELLKKCKDISFLGNIEGRDILTGKADIMVCDGFIGNIILKTIEGTASTLFGLLKKEIGQNTKSKVGGMLLKTGLKNLKSHLDYSEHGGAPLLGVNGVSIICHGSSKASAIKNGIRVAAECVQNGFVQEIENTI